MTVYVNATAVIGPGLEDPAQILRILHGEENWQFIPLSNLKPAMLPANERRRTTPVINLALQCLQGLTRSTDDLRSIATVFASSDGELGIADKICSALAEAEKIVSPTLFHNSVHNSAAGYWAIAASMQGPSTSLSAGDATFMCGLQEAVTRVMTEQGTVLFVAYDYPVPRKLAAYRHIEYPLAIAMRLGATAETGVLGTLLLEGAAVDAKQSHCRNSSLENLRQGLAIGCGLPLIEALNRRARMQVILPYLRGTHYCVQVSH